MFSPLFGPLSEAPEGEPDVVVPQVLRGRLPAFRGRQTRLQVCGAEACGITFIAFTSRARFCVECRKIQRRAVFRARALAVRAAQSTPEET